MKKIILQGIILALLFIATWLLLMQIDWMSLLKIEQGNNKTYETIVNIMPG